ncbi:MAG: DUF58 domain-containing protein [Planctomycetota bacterium]
MSGGARQGRAAGPPCARAQEPADFLARLERLHETLARRLSQGDGNRSADGRGRGSDFAGFRPYRSGEDVRQLDFALLARLGKPFVRILRPDARESWLILLDGSASMAVGPPGKWQSAVELGLAAAHLLLRRGAAVEVRYSAGALVSRRLGRPSDWAGLRAQLWQTEAAGAEVLSSLLSGVRLNGRHVLAIGDLFRESLDPWLQAARQAAQVTLVRILSEVERDPPQGAVAWHASESEGAPRLTEGQGARQVYLERLAAEERQWREGCARVGADLLLHSAGQPFEQVLQAGRGGF